MISGAHVIIHSRDADADRAFIRDVLGFPHVDAGGGWLVFALPPAEVAVHPTGGEQKHELYLLCDDLEQTRADLAGVGVTMSASRQERWGVLATVPLPGGGLLPLYEPRHPLAHGAGG